MSAPAFVVTHSNPRRGRRRTERVGWRWLLSYYAALWRGAHTARLVLQLRALRERQRAEAWVDPSRML